MAYAFPFADAFFLFGVPDRLVEIGIYSIGFGIAEIDNGGHAICITIKLYI
jgi:hypothetical protein